MLVAFYMGTAYLTGYGTDPDGAGLQRPTVSGIRIIAGIVFGVAILVAGTLSDRFGCRNVIIALCGRKNHHTGSIRS